LTDERKDGDGPPPRYEGRVPILPGPEDRKNAERDREKEAEREYKKRQTSIQIGILVTQILLVFFGVVGSGISWYQAITARQSAEQAKRAADLASDSFEATYGENGIAERTMRQMVDQTTAQIGSARTSLDGLEAARDQIRLDQRAWVEVDMWKLTTFEVGRPLGLSVMLMNRGKTPALDVRVGATDDRVISNDHTPSQIAAVIEENLKKAEAAATQFAPITPSNGASVNGASTRLLDAGRYNAVRSGISTYYVTGKVIYRDVFHRRQWITYCLKIGPKSDGGFVAVYCDTGNNMSH